MVEVLVRRRSARIERPLTYAAPPELELGLGDAVRVPLGSRTCLGIVVGGPHAGSDAIAGLRPVAARLDGPPLLDAESLALAQWLAERTCCSLDEALAAFLAPGALPRVVERIVPLPALARGAPPSVPARFVRLLREDFPDGVALGALLRHPEARRAGERRELLAALATLARAGDQ
ncbi:MAG: hypothetical protein ACREQ5_16535, partial [Candidatus Dormibacteria bacterium]